MDPMKSIFTNILLSEAVIWCFLSLFYSISTYFLISYNVVLCLVFFIFILIIFIKWGLSSIGLGACDFFLLKQKKKRCKRGGKFQVSTTDVHETWLKHPLDLDLDMQWMETSVHSHFNLQIFWKFGETLRRIRMGAFRLFSSLLTIHVPHNEMLYSGEGLRAGWSCWALHGGQVSSLYTSARRQDPSLSPAAPLYSPSFLSFSLLQSPSFLSFTLVCVWCSFRCL